ncbi:hypothetical protein NBRC116601_30210 [Cognatishimia sp. WU-CL00825]|uniref:hypothetical protein n=1 Tax=Cognatishimia sp. WU-CL00825 TaxID=3127658 RepID=UPI00310A7BDD
MVGWKLFKHAVLMIVRNFTDILRIGFLPMLTAIASIGLLAFALVGSGSISNAASQFTWLVLPFFAIGFFCMFWFIVGWHRFVLLQEMPNGWLNKPNGKIANYFGTIVKLFLVSLLCMMPALLILLAFKSLPILLFPIMLSYMFVVFYLLFRLSISLPAAAIGEPLTLGETLAATEGNLGAFIVLFLCSLVFQLAVQFLASVLIIVPILAAVVSLAGTIFTSMLNVSILTTLYGYFVEKREL